MDTVTYAILNKRITSSITGIGSVKLIGNNTLEFTNKQDGSKFTVKLPFDMETIEVVSTLPTPTATLVDKVYFLLSDNCFYKCVKDTASTYKFQDITSSGMNIYDNFNSFPKVFSKDTICYAKNDYTDTSSGTVRKSGFYLYDATKKSWTQIGGSATSDYTTQITTASKIWNIQHNLNTEWWKLQINIIDNDGNVVYGDVDLSATTNNLLVLNFEKEVQGKIYIKK